MKRIFVSFAMEDVRLRDLLRGQARNENSPFEYIDMSVKNPWDSKWKTNCRTRIKGCDGVIAIITNNSKDAEGQLWEIKCAKEEGIPILGIYGYEKHYWATLPASYTIRIVDWRWNTIASWLRGL